LISDGWSLCDALVLLQCLVASTPVVAVAHALFVGAYLRWRCLPCSGFVVLSLSVCDSRFSSRRCSVLCAWPVLERVCDVLIMRSTSSWWASLCRLSSVAASLFMSVLSCHCAGQLPARASCAALQVFLFSPSILRSTLTCCCCLLVMLRAALA